MNQEEEVAPSFVESFRIAAPYIHEHRGKTFVILVGGEAAVEKSFARLIHDIALVHAFGIRVVLVHGTRLQIEQKLKTKGIPSVIEEGERVTDDDAMACVLEAVGVSRARFESMLSMGATNTPMAGARIRVTGGNFLTAQPIGVRAGVDFGSTGVIRRVDAPGISAQLDGGALVLISPLGFSPTGEVFNLSSHAVARAVAVALQADKLIGLVEGKGVVDAKRRLITEMTPSEAETRAGRKSRMGKDVRKHLQATAAAVRAGVRRAHLVGRRSDGALLQELFTRDGQGTLITAETFEDMRPASVDDVGPLSLLLKPMEDSGTLVRRSVERLEIEVERFTVVERDGLMIGCAALEFFPDEQVAELYCVAVHPHYRDAGRGDRLLRFMEERAVSLGAQQLFVLTTHSAHFFQERGFTPSTVRKIPKVRRKSYDRKRRSRILIKSL